MDELQQYAALFPEYELVRVLGRGATSIVFEVVNKEGERVALKVFQGFTGHPNSFSKAAEREVKNLGKIRSNRVARLLDSKLSEPNPHLVMELVQGSDLAQTVLDRPLSGLLLHTMVESLIEAIAEIHGAGLVHRDLKPANVVFGNDGVKVVDFGISGSDSVVTAMSSSFSGTPGWVSPEQATGDTVGPASDIFSLGLLIAFACSGVHPFGEGRPDAMLFRIVNSEPDLSSVPLIYQELVRSCLEKDPEQRPDIGQLRKFVSSISSQSMSDQTVVASGTMLLANSKSPNRGAPSTSKFLRSRRPGLSRKRVALFSGAAFALAILLFGFFGPASGPMYLEFTEQATNGNPPISESMIRVTVGSGDPEFFVLPTSGAVSGSQKQRTLVGSWSRNESFRVDLTSRFSGDESKSLTITGNQVGGGFLTHQAPIVLEVRRTDGDVKITVKPAGALFGLIPLSATSALTASRGNEQTYLAEQAEGLRVCKADLSSSWKRELQPVIDLNSNYKSLYGASKFGQGVFMYWDQWRREGYRLADAMFDDYLKALPYSPDQQGSRTEPYTEPVVFASREVFLSHSVLVDYWEELARVIGNNVGSGDLESFNTRNWTLIRAGESALASAASNLTRTVVSEAESICRGAWPDG